MGDLSNDLASRWVALGRAEAVFCRPWLGMDLDTARERLDPHARLGFLQGKDVLCLAGGGGQQSAAFALLGARVTVLDLAEAQLEKDEVAARAYGSAIRTERGDMRDLSRFADASFDLVWHPYSVNFVPEIEDVVAGVARVIRGGGTYVLMVANPFAHGVGSGDWTGEGYVVRRPYLDGAVREYDDEGWVHQSEEEVPPPREYVHTLGTVVRLLVQSGFVLRHLDEDVGRADAEPGSWEHLRGVLPPWLVLWSELGR